MREMYYDSCGKGQIYACCWEPEEEPRGIVQIIHGIAEHIDRYDDFAFFLAQNGMFLNDTQKKFLIWTQLKR